ncbi:MAG: regulatory signaling modulator protein AmpE [Alishewanella sp.]|nr:regulatory signaling modulator protein AmpE [Alishewanella sp.]
MTLISMLLALIIERLAVRSDAWQARPYCQAYLKLTAGSGLSKLAEHSLGRYLWLLLPGLVIALILHFVDSRLISLIVNTLVLLVAIGCWHYRQLYKQFLNAQERGDDEAAYLAMQQIREDSASKVDDSNGLLLVWLNFRYYAAVVFWFLVLGAFGAVTYALLRHVQEQPQLKDERDDQVETVDALDESETAATDNYSSFNANKAEATPKDAVHYLLFWADWFPARLFGLGFALVGHFSRASNALLGYFLDFTADNQQVITDVAKAAEPIVDVPQEVSDDTGSMVQLAKRNMLFFLAFTAILTLSGWIS